MREGLLALSVGVGLKVLDELLEEELLALVGPKGKHNPERTANRHGSRSGRVVLGGRKVAVRRPRARTREGGPRARASHLRPLRLRRPALRADGGDDAGRALDPSPPGRARADRHGRSLSLEVGGLAPFVARRRSLAELIARPVPDDLLVLMLDGVVLAGHTCLCALGIRADKQKVPLGLWEGASENAAVCRRALADLGERGAEQDLLVCVDGAKALRKAVSEALGAKTAVQRCRRHKEQNVLSHLPEGERPWVKRKLREAWAAERAELAERRLVELARALSAKRPGAAASLREGAWPRR